MYWVQNRFTTDRVKNQRIEECRKTSLLCGGKKGTVKLASPDGTCSTSEFEPEAKLGTVCVSKRCTRPLSSAEALRLAKRTAVKIRVGVVTGVVAIANVVHFPDQSKFHVLADLEGIRGAKVKFDERLAAEAISLRFLAAESIRPISASGLGAS